MPQVDKLLIGELLEAYRLQRHDFLNHWQVVTGYLQLNHAEKALQYIRTMLPEFEAEQLAGLIPEKSASACILTLIVKLHKEGIPLELKLAKEWNKEEFWSKYWREEYLQALYGYTSECLELSLHSQELPLKTVLTLGREPGDAEDSKAVNEAGLSFKFELYPPTGETGKKAGEQKATAIELILGE